MIRINEVSKSLIKLFLVLAFNSQLMAATLDDLSDDDFFNDVPMVLTVSRLEQPKSESPSAVTIIDREMIKASGIRELSDVFRLVPGFVVGNVSGSTPVVAYHGMGSNFNRQLQVIIDGRSVYIPSFGGIPWTNLPVILEDIERIEITRGPNAASYGANAFLAVINIITKDASQDSGSHISVIHSGDHKNVNDIYFSTSRQLSEYDFRLSAKTVNDNGFKPFDASTVNNDSKKVAKFNLKSNFLMTQNSHWTFQFGQNDASLSRGKLNNAEDIIREEIGVNRYLSLGFEKSSQKSSTSIKLFHTEHDVKDSFNVLYKNIIPAIVGFDRYSQRTEIELEKTTDHSSQLRTVVGGSFRKDTVDSFFLLGKEQKQSLNVSRLFAHAEYKFDHDKILNVGSMFEDSDAADFEVSPRIAYVQHLNPKHTIRLAYSKAFRNPILFELNGRWAFKLQTPNLLNTDILELNKPNSGLKPEEINSFEIGLYSQISHSFQTDLKLYQYEVSNKITSPNNNKFINDTTSIAVDGIELSLSYKPSLNFFISSGFNLIQSQSQIISIEQSFPKKTFFLLTQYDFNQHHSLSGFYSYVQDISWFDFAHEDLGDTNKLDIRYAYNFTTNDHSPFTLEIIGQNLLNDYADYIDTNIRSPSYFIKLSGNF